MPRVALPEKVLFVDDEPEVLESFRRQLRGKFNIHTAVGGAEGLNALARQGPFAVVVSDLKMPGMDGVTFLAQVATDFPETVRVMLTGFADVQNAIAAVNEGNIFRFLTKPCPEDQIIRALVASIRQYRLAQAEKELLEQTLQGSIKVLTDILSLVNPAAFGRAARISRYVTQVGHVLGYPTMWELEAAGMLSQIGCLTLPESLLGKVMKGVKLDRQEEKLYAQHPALAAELITAIPRMETVSFIVAHQETAFDGSGPGNDSPSGPDIPLGARILKVVLDFDAREFSGSSRGKALEHLKHSAKLYDPQVLEALEEVLGEEAKYDIRDLGIYELNPGMVLADDVLPKRGGRKLLAKGLQLSNTLIMTIRNYNRAVGVREPIKVIIPLGG